MTTEQKAAAAARYNVTVADIDAAASPAPTDPCKKWKDAFYAAVVLWLTDVMAGGGQTPQTEG